MLRINKQAIRLTQMQNNFTEFEQLFFDGLLDEQDIEYDESVLAASLAEMDRMESILVQSNKTTWRLNGDTVPIIFLADSLMEQQAARVQDFKRTPLASVVGHQKSVLEFFQNAMFKIHHVMQPKLKRTVSLSLGLFAPEYFKCLLLCGEMPVAQKFHSKKVWARGNSVKQELYTIQYDSTCLPYPSGLDWNIRYQYQGGWILAMVDNVALSFNFFSNTLSVKLYFNLYTHIPQNSIVGITKDFWHPV